MAPWPERQIKVYMLMVWLCAAAWTSAVTPPNSTLAEFEQWMAHHGRIYKDNLEKAKRKAANQSYKVGLNQFSDLTTEEFVPRYTGFRATSRSSKSSAATTFKYSMTQVPDSLNWVEKGVVGSIKDQGECGTCNERAASIAVARLKGYENIPSAIEGFSPGFKQYSGGVFNGPCGENINHAVAIAGYGKTPDGVDYWLLKNSWGETWGEKGYMRILRNSGVQGSLCGLVTQATLPVAY
ncbi:cysteine protease XCP1-like [Eucalyptus grandis]|uniref:cysteine protease XCP1-like n=1 Tax=Eucalyptus grandis TaxID=71139 RepID=UPI00192E7C30|nr:cysteine protease XCP1-like [Eucalyptus grandis]